MRLEVCFINHSTVLPDAEVSAIVGALQTQVDRDFRPTWGVAAHIVQIAAGQKPPAGVAWIGIFDDSDQAGALGYHDLTPSRHPLGKVFAKTDQQYGAEPSVTCSHELLELLGDPYINLMAFDSQHGRLYAYENADAVEADELGYRIGDILVSDFVLPQYFDEGQRGLGHALSFQGHVSEPFSLAKGGYLSYLDINNVTAGWQQVTAEGTPDERVRASGERTIGFPPGSRRERRIKAFDGSLVLSEVETA